MPNRYHTDAAGPTDAEARMMGAYDVFNQLLASRPNVARQLAYEVDQVVERYKQPVRQKATERRAAESNG